MISFSIADNERERVKKLRAIHAGLVDRGAGLDPTSLPALGDNRRERTRKLARMRAAAADIGLDPRGLGASVGDNPDEVLRGLNATATATQKWAAPPTGLFWLPVVFDGQFVTFDNEHVFHLERAG